MKYQINENLTHSRSRKLMFLLVFTVCMVMMSLPVFAATTKKQLRSPDAIGMCISGDVLIVEFDIVDGADYYEYCRDSDYDGTAIGNIQTKAFKSDNLYMELLNDQKRISVWVRACDSTGKYSPSEWELNRFPEDPRDISQSNFIDASNFDLERIKKWANYKNLTYTIEEDDNFVVIDVKEKDSWNSGGLKRIGRFAAGFFEPKNRDELAQGLYDSETNLIEWAIKKKANASDNDGTIKGKVQDSAYGLLAKALNASAHSLFKYTFDDTSIHYKYFFEKDMTEFSCVYAEMSMQENGHADLGRKLGEITHQDKEGRDYIHQNTGMDVYVNVYEDESAGVMYPVWRVQLMPYRWWE